MAREEGFGRNRLQRKHPEARNIPVDGRILGPFATFSKALLAASTVQIAAAAEHHKARKLYRAPAPVTQEFRNSNAYWPAPSVGGSRYESGAETAPAGR
jgi:hypothetical protein